jgi:hypothetical protein
LGDKFLFNARKTIGVLLHALELEHRVSLRRGLGDVIHHVLAENSRILSGRKSRGRQ